MLIRLLVIVASSRVLNVAKMKSVSSNSDSSAISSFNDESMAVDGLLSTAALVKPPAGSGMPKFTINLKDLHQVRNINIYIERGGKTVTIIIMS